MKLRDTVIFCALLILLALAWFVFSYGYIEDDAFIHLEFARSVAEGAGFAFNGSPANGDTAPLWVLLLTAIHAAGPGWIASAKLACMLGLLITIAALWRLASDLPNDERRNRQLAMAVVAVTVLNPFLVHWSFSGMESVTALGVSLWAIWAVFVRPPSWGGLTFAAILLGIGPLLRPELLLLAAISGLFVLWSSWQLARVESPTARTVRTASLAIVMALPVLIWCGYAVHAFGTMVPNTNVAKRGGTLMQLAPRLASVYLVGFPLTLGILPLIASRRVRRADVPAAVVVLLLWPLACIGFYLADHTLVQTRYCLLSMPCMGIAVLWLIDSSRRPILWRASVTGMILVALLTIWLTVVPHVGNKKEGLRAFAAVSSFLRSNVPAQDPVAVYAIGEIAFDSRHPLVDIGGITRPSVVPYLNDPPAVVRWAEGQGARYFISGTQAPEPGAEAVFSTAVPFLGWTLDRARYRTAQSLVVYRLPLQNRHTPRP